MSGGSLRRMVVFCDRVGEEAPIWISEREGLPPSVVCRYREGLRECQHRAEVGCALYERFDTRGNPIVDDFSKVIDRWRLDVTYRAISALLEASVSFLVGGRDAVNAYCPEVVEKTDRTDIFIKLQDKAKAWRVLSRSGFKVEAVDPTYFLASKEGVAVEVHCGTIEKPYVDDEVIKRAIKLRFLDRQVLLQPIEDILLHKVDRFLNRDVEDLKRLLSGWREKIDWEYLKRKSSEMKVSLKKLETLKKLENV